MTSNLEKKIEHSIELIKKSEKLSLVMSDKGFHVGFSGGKDSQVVLELTKMAGVKYEAVYNVTTNDPPTNVRFIKEHYPDVIFDRPRKSFMQLVAEGGMPTRLFRFCCRELKEKGGFGMVNLLGVRSEESVKRSKYNEIEKIEKRVEDRGKEINLEQMEERNFQCVTGKDKFSVYPILSWTEEDVWEFIRERHLPVNPCYETHNRVGCVFCPFTPKRNIRKAIIERPKQYQALLHAIQKYIDGYHSNGQVSQFKTAEEYMDWWLSNDNIRDFVEKKKQTTIDFEE